MKLRSKIHALILGLALPFLAIAGLESVTYISDLVVTNPLSSDPAHQGDDHLRAIKVGIKNTFPNINAAMTQTDEQLNGGGVNITGKAGHAKTLSTSAASGGADGDIWYRY